MGRASKVSWLAWLLIGLAACCTEPTRNGQPKTEAERVEVKYGPYFPVLSTEERGMFDELESDDSRDLFLRERGADVKCELSQKLRLGMRGAKVRELLGPPLDEERTFAAGQLLEYWSYRRPNPVGDTLFTVRFAGGKVIGWDVKTTAGY